LRRSLKEERASAERQSLSALGGGKAAMVIELQIGALI
jgi:hypothetical protein